VPNDATRLQAGRMLAAGAAIAVVLAGCGSSHHPGASSTTASSATSTTPTSTTPANAPTTATADPNQQYNPIPFNVGEVAGLPNGWSVQVAKVTRPFVAAGLAAAPAGQQYVMVRMKMANLGLATVTVNAAKIFAIVDNANAQHAVVPVPGQPSGLDGSFASGVVRTGELIFAVPVGRRLQMLLDGPAIGTQRTVFQIDPPKTPPRD
jgi:Domain of unknown function (DUF4352)